LTLYAFRAPAVSSRVSFDWVSRESLLLCNNVVFLVAALTVLFGTMFPLIVDALGMGKVSVGPPYFNAVFVPLMALLVPVMGLGPISRWKRDTVSRWRAELVIPTVVAVLCGITLPLLHAPYNIWVALAVLLSSWLVLGLAKDFWQRLRSASSTAAGLRRLTPGYCGMVIAHLGFAACVTGIVATSQYSVENDLKMDPGDSRELAGYEFRFIEVAKVRGPNFVADQAHFEVFQDGRMVASMNPQKRRYLASGSVMTEAAIDAGLFRDLFVAMGEPVGNEGAWAVRLHYKPLVRWMWLGAILMAVGAFTAVADKRYRRQRAVVGETSKAALHGA
jgi:cytochrome c-type biogenesis protein CcmF